jgi:SAM domain (Sterile alpha motif)/Adenylate and Guanylate cyclase catalytic domain
MQQVTDWLEKLGMSEYAQRFADNDIDLSILGDLTDQDLKDLGVASLGHRRKILRAITELDRSEATAAHPAAARAPPSGPAPPSPAPTPVAAPQRTTLRPQEAGGERRYLTVMFCDLVGSTGIAAQPDAEEWRHLVGAYLDAASAAVTEMGGHVAKKLGDGLMALFGYPLAHENDAERAARAALSESSPKVSLKGRDSATNGLRRSKSGSKDSQDSETSRASASASSTRGSGLGHPWISAR